MLLDVSLGGFGPAQPSFGPRHPAIPQDGITQRGGGIPRSPVIDDRGVEISPLFCLVSKGFGLINSRAVGRFLGPSGWGTHGEQGD